MPYSPSSPYRSLRLLPQQARFLTAYLAIATFLTVLAFACNMRASTVNGLYRTVHPVRDTFAPPLRADVVRDLPLNFPNPTSGPGERAHIIWRGLWLLPDTRAVRLSIGGDYRLSVWIDSVRVLSRQPTETTDRSATLVTLDSGFHSLAVEYDGRADVPRIDLQGDGLVPHRLFHRHAGPFDVWVSWAGAWTKASAAVMWLTAVVILLPSTVAVCVLFLGKLAFLYNIARRNRHPRFLTTTWALLGGPRSHRASSPRDMPRHLGNVLCIDGTSIEKMLHRTLPVAFLAFFATGVIHAVQNHFIRASYSVGDWLINYQGGFVRRGLVGEIVYRLYQMTAIDPALYVLLLKILLYSAFLGFSYLLLRRENLVPYALLIFAPFVFAYYDGSGPIGFRKEEIFLMLLALSVWLLQPAHGGRADLAFIAILGLYPLVVLSHEMLFAFLPYLLAAYVLADRRARPRHSVWVLPFTCMSALCFSVVLLYGRGAPGVTEKILDSLRGAGYPISGGAIAALDWSTSYAHDAVMESLVLGYFPNYIVTVMLVLLGFVPAHERLGRLARNRIGLFLIALAIALTLPVFLVAFDWGRFIRVHAVALFLLCLGSDAVHRRQRKAARSQNELHIPMLQATLWTIGALSYIAFWRIPHSGHPSLEQPSVFVSEPVYFTVLLQILEVLGDWLGMCDAP